MKKEKIGTIFLVTILGLASIGISYAGFTDSINIYGTVNTATVELDLEAYSGTDVYKVWGTEIQPDDEIRIFRGYSFERPNPTDPDAIKTYFNLPETTNVELISSAWSHDYIGDEEYDIGMTFDNLFPCIDFTADFIVHYEGSIPAKVNVAEWILYTDWLEELYQAGGVTVEAYRCSVPNPDQPLGPDNYPTVIQEVVDLDTQLHYCDYVKVMLTLHLPQNNYWQDKSGEFAGKIGVIQWNEHPDGECGGTDFTKIYTFDADFDEGTLVGVQYETVHDQLQLSSEFTTLPFIWVPNSNEGTVSKYDTVTGNELGRYWTGPTVGGSPSRTTVDLEGNCWVGNRATGTVVKIGLFEAGNWIDKNGNTVPDTSTDLNGDTDITNAAGTEILPWNTDECLLFETYIGGGPRGLAVDANNDLWVGQWTAGSNNFYHIAGDTGAIIAADTISIAPYQSYGAVIDGNGIIWSSSLSNYVLKIDPSVSPATVTPIYFTGDDYMVSYGITVDGSGHVFVASWGQTKIAKIDISTNALVTGNQVCSNGRGIAVTSDGDVWVIDSLGTAVNRFDNNLVFKKTIDIGTSGVSTGVAVDAAGKVWTCNYDDGYIKRIDPTGAADSLGAIDLQKHTPGYTGAGSGNHYSYSDMTGIIARTVTTQLGTWEVVYDAGVTADFSMVTWTDFVPADTSITVEVASSTDGTTWSSWETATNGGALSAPNGQYLKVKVTFQITDGDVSPILYDLTIHGHTT